MVRAILLEPQPPMMEVHIRLPERLRTGSFRARDKVAVLDTLTERMGSNELS